MDPITQEGAGAEAAEEAAAAAVAALPEEVKALTRADQADPVRTAEAEVHMVEAAVHTEADITAADRMKPEECAEVITITATGEIRHTETMIIIRVRARKGADAAVHAHRAVVIRGKSHVLYQERPRRNAGVFLFNGAGMLL